METQSAPSVARDRSNLVLLVILALCTVGLTIDLWLEAPRVNPFQCVVAGSAAGALSMHLARYYVRAEPWTRVLRVLAFALVGGAGLYFLVLLIRGT